MKELQAWRKLSERRPGDVQLDTELKQIQKTATKRTRAAWHANVTNTSQQQRGKTRQGLGMSDNSTCEPVFCLTIGALSVGHKHSRRSSCFRSKAAQHRGRRKRQGPLSTAVAVSVSSNSQTHRRRPPPIRPFTFVPAPGSCALVCAGRWDSEQTRKPACAWHQRWAAMRTSCHLGSLDHGS